MEGVYSYVCGRPCWTCEDTRMSIREDKGRDDMTVTKALNHTILT